MKRDPAGAIVVAIAVAALSAWVLFRFHTGIVLEDALITWRYAANLAAGNGFVFNIGERVLGTTSPLLALLLGGVGAALGKGAIPGACAVMMMAAMAGAGLFARASLRALGQPAWVANLAMAALLLHPDVLWSTTGGMETPLVLLLMAASLYSVVTGRHRCAGVMAGLLVLARIDGAIWAAGVLAVCAVSPVNRSRAFMRAAVGAALVVLPWLLFATLYFGSPLPHSVVAKRVIGTTGSSLDAGRMMEFLWWNSRFFGAAIPGLWPAGLALYIAAAVRLIRWGSPTSRALALFPVVFSGALYLGGTPLYFDWYLLPVAFTCIVACAAALPSMKQPSAMVLSAVGLVGVALFAWQGSITAAWHRAYQENETGLRRVVGDWLRDNTDEGSVVAMEAIGYQGYYSGRRVVDLAGLVSPEVITIRRESGSNADAFHRVIAQRRPDYIVLRSFEVDRNAHFHGGRLFETDIQTRTFVESYQEVKRFVAPHLDLWGETGKLTVYERRNARAERRPGGASSGRSLPRSTADLHLHTQRL